MAAVDPLKQILQLVNQYDCVLQLLFVHLLPVIGPSMMTASMPEEKLPRDSSGSIPDTPLQADTHLSTKGSSTTLETGNYGIIPTLEAGVPEKAPAVFRNFWHEMLFIFVVTSAQLITVRLNPPDMGKQTAKTRSPSSNATLGTLFSQYRPFPKAWESQTNR
jgi:hypothetical protein